MRTMEKMWVVITIAIIAGILMFSARTPITSAQAGPLPSGNNVSLLNPLCTSGSANCQNSTAEGLLQSIVKQLFVIATPIAVGMILIGAFQMLLSGGNEDKFTTGKKTVLYAVIGYAIILIGWGITSIIQSLLS
jgi:hypothetical protein